MNIKDRVVSKQRFFAHLRALSASKKTGTLVVIEPDVERRLFFENGAIVAATSTSREESLGYLLAERAIVKEHTVRHAVELHRAKPALLGRRLVDLGAMSEKEIQHAVRLKVRETISDILSTPDAEINLNDECFPDVDRVLVSIEVGELLSSGIDVSERKPAQRTTPVETLSPPPMETPPPEPVEEHLDPAERDLIQALEGFTGKHSLASLAEPKESTVSTAWTGARPSTGSMLRPPVPKASAHPPAAASRNSLMVALAAGVSLAALAVGYWFISQSPAQAPSVATTAPPEPVVAVGAPEPATQMPTPSRQPETPPTREVGPTVREPAAVPSSDSPRQTVRTTSEPPPPPSRREVIEQASAASAPTPATTQPSAEASPVPEPAAPVVEPAPPPSLPGAETSPSDGATTQPGEGEGWGSAVFAPKRAAVTSNAPSDPGVQPGDLVEPSFDVIDPVLIEHPELKYPREAKRQNVSEFVIRVRVLVDENGTVLEANMEEPARFGLDQVAIDVALKARFIPATKGRVQVKMWTVLPLVFRDE
ncbi:MAG TPA: TonB family protein [Vicinamibacteria bacterium]|nr:TonB family protein [Vicinamibacteria bacterium]